MRIGGETPSFEPQPLDPAPAARRAPAAAGEGAFARALHGLAGTVDRGEALIARATAGHVAGLDSAQLIALQAGIYRYSEAVDLLAKLVDRASSAVRTVVSPH
jgi:hypothetical protein